MTTEQEQYINYLTERERIMLLTYDRYKEAEDEETDELAKMCMNSTKAATLDAVTEIRWAITMYKKIHNIIN